jgi:hypothetical protein
MTAIFAVFLRYRRLLLRGAAALALLILAAIIVHGATRPPHIVQLDPITKVVEVPVEKITTKTVTQYVKVEDRAAAKQLLADNEKLKATVQQLTVSLAEATSRGQGETVITIPSTTPETPPQIIEVPVEVKFKDWRLNFQSVGTSGTYTLSQKFSILNTVGRNENNVPVNVVRLFEIGEHGERLPIPTVETTTISVQPDQMRFYLKPTLQAGLGVLPEWLTINTPTTTGGTTKYPVSGVVAIPWWKRGTTRAVETTRYAYLTPAMTINGEQVVLGLLPISANIGTVKHVPFTDLWVSPFIGISSKNSTKKFGIVFTTTF